MLEYSIEFNEEVDDEEFLLDDSEIDDEQSPLHDSEIDDEQSPLHDSEIDDEQSPLHDSGIDDVVEHGDETTRSDDVEARAVDEDVKM